MIVLADVETDGLDYTKIHCICVKVWETKETKSFVDTVAFDSWCEGKEISKWVFHNGLNFDLKAINDLTGTTIKPEDVIDTSVVSKLVDYGKFHKHSLKELGEYLGVHKGDYEGGWDTCTNEMIGYCEQDVEVLEAIFKYYRPQIFSKNWAKSMRVEHDMATICLDMQTQGFTFNVDKAEKILAEVVKDKGKLEDGFRSAFKSTLVETKRLKILKTKEGKLYATVLKAMSEYPKTEITEDGKELIVYDYKEFNPGSPIERVDMLWDAGWKPFSKTKGYTKKLREERGKKRW